jgi:hypothetical protein
MEFCRSARGYLLLVSPFIKVSVLEALLAGINEETEVEIVSRWHPQDILSGASDLDVWLLVEARQRTRLFLRQDLHAKYYAQGGLCMMGSTNLTRRALGVCRAPNFELLVECDRLLDFEQSLRSGSVLATKEIYDSLAEALSDLPQKKIFELDWEFPVSPSDVEVVPATWSPQFRNPEDLFDVYQGTAANLSSAALSAGYDDLSMLRPPQGLDREQFAKIVGAILRQTHVVQGILALVEESPQRFGRVREELATLRDSRQDIQSATQTLYRWLRYFLPDIFSIGRPNHSEILGMARNGSHSIRPPL